MYADILERTNTNPTPLEEILREREAIERSFARIRKAFFLEAIRSDHGLPLTLAEEFNSLRDHVALLFTLDPPDSASTIATSCPHLAIEADLLGRERDELFLALSDLADRAEGGRGRFRHGAEQKLELEFVQFEARFLEHQIREAEFTNHTLYDEIGVGD